MMRASLIAVLLLAFQEPPPGFERRLDDAEKLGFAIPDLPDAVASLDASIAGAKLAPEFGHRLQTLRAQAAVLASFHGRLLQRKGGMFDVPLTPGKPVSVKIVDVRRKGVQVNRPEGTQEVAYADLDPEWIASIARAGLAAGTDGDLSTALWLAKASKWEAAFVALAGHATDHPLASEARKRGLESGLANVESLTQAKRWTDALARLQALTTAAPSDGRIAASRTRLLHSMVEHGKDLCRKGSKVAMKELIDLITKHFPDAAPRIEEIREANRWVKVTDPKRFRLEGITGRPPWLIDPGDKPGVTKYILEVEEPFQAVSITVRFDPGSKADGGIAWKVGACALWINSKKGVLCAGQGEGPGKPIHSSIDKDIPMDGKHTILLKISNGEYAVFHNGVEMGRMESKERWITGVGLHVVGGKVWYDEILLLKKEP